MASRVQAKVWT